MEGFKKGDIVFSEHGQRYEYVAEADGDHVVRPILETDEEEPYAGRPITLLKVFASAPREMYDKTIEALDTKVQELTKQKRELEDELRKSKQDETERKKRIMVNAALARIDDFLAGKMTHLAMKHWSGWSILSIQEALAYKESDYDRVAGGVKLLTLFGKTNGNLEWQLSHYSDGSGSPTEVRPFFSLEDAQAFVRAICEQKWQAWRDSSKEWGSASEAAQNAIKLGFEIPEDVAVTLRLYMVKNKTDRVSEAKVKLQAAEAELAEVNDKTIQELVKGEK